jgi:hypothetical protein
MLLCPLRHIRFTSLFIKNCNKRSFRLPLVASNKQTNPLLAKFLSLMISRGGSYVNKVTQGKAPCMAIDQNLCNGNTFL